MSAYVVAHLHFTDRDRYRDYEAGFGDVFARFGGELVAVDDAATTLEGDETYGRVVIARFADTDTARAWYESPEYQALAAIRQEASAGTITLLEGRDAS